MPKVKVWNDNVHPYSEVYKGDPISIPAGGCIEMEYDEAIQFRGTFKAPIKDEDGKDKPEGYKMIRVDGQAPAVVLTDLVCQACKEKFEKQASLDLHLKHAHTDQALEKPETDADVDRRRRTRAAS